MGRFSLFLCVALLVLAASAQRKSKKSSKQAKKTDGKIVGGEWAHISQFPFLVSLQYRTGKHFCGGSIISPDFVLTAAHCTEGLFPGDIQVVAGVTYLDWEVPQQKVDVSSIINHYGYERLTVNNDIALLRLATPLNIGGNIQKIDLDHNEFATWDSLKVAGWGATVEDGQESNMLLQTNLPGVSRSYCKRKYSHIGAINNNMICAGYTEGGIDACQGDSGGPAVSVSTRKQVGIVSFGSGCARADTPGVYTNVANYISWISMNTGLAI